LFLETLFKLSDASTSIEDALFAGIERVTDGANFYEE
jgi:rubrerythrin